MPAYPPPVLLPGDPGDTSARGRPVRLALLAFAVCLSGAAAASGVPLPLSGHSAAVVVSAPPAAIRAPLTPVATRPVRREHASPGHAALHRSQPSAPAAHRPTHANAHPAAPKRWLPTGTGMWIHEWDKSGHGNARAVVHRARTYGVRTLYVRTASNQDGYFGPQVLSRLLPATRHTGIRVVAWDFPTLRHPVKDATRLVRAARYRAPGRGTPRVAAVAPDIETAAEGTHINAARVAKYLRVLRRWLPRDVAILTTVPWPSEQRVGRYPYRAAARGSDALLPMTYWYNRSPSGVTAYSVRVLRRLHRPVFPVGQAFDSKADAPYLRHSHQWREVAGFMRAARATHVRAISLWSWQTAGPAQWHALHQNRRSFH